MTYLAQHVTSRDLDSRSNSDLDLRNASKTCTYFDAFRREEHDAAKMLSLALLVQKLFAKKQVLQKKHFFDLS